MWKFPQSLDKLEDGGQARILHAYSAAGNTRRPHWDYGPYRGGFIHRTDDGQVFFIDGKFEVPIESTRMVQVPKQGKEDRERGAAG